MTHDKLIEAVARAIFACHFADTAEAQSMMQKDWNRPSPLMTMVRNEARAAIRVIAPAVERALRERDQAVEALRLFVRLMNDPDYDLGELCEEFCTRAETILASIEGTGHE